MLSIQGSPELRRVVVLNPKGGAGKSTLTATLAGYFAASGRKVAIIDMDRQGSSAHWLGRRSAEYPDIHGVFSASYNPGVAVDFSVNLPSEVELVIVDTPAGVLRRDLAEFISGSHAVIVPVMPSEFDIHAASGFIADIMLEARTIRENGRLGVIANRVKERTVASRRLMDFLNRLSIPVVGVIRDSQAYVATTREGVSIHELPPSQFAKDLRCWKPITEWLEKRLATSLSEDDMRQSVREEALIEPVQTTRRFNWIYAAVGVFVLLATWLLLWDTESKPEEELVVAPMDTVEEVPEAGIAAAQLESLPSPEEEIVELAVDLQPVAPLSEEDITRTDTNPEQNLDENSLEVATAPLTPSEALLQKWRFKGVAQADGELYAILTDSSGEVTRTVTGNISVDGWYLKEAGPGYAVLEKDNDVVRLKFGQ